MAKLWDRVLSLSGWCMLTTDAAEGERVEIRPTVIHVTAVAMTLKFFSGQFRYLQQNGFEVHAVSTAGALLQEVAEAEGIQVHSLPISRRLTPWQDLMALVRLWWLFCRIRPRIVHAHTPKAGMLAMIAATLARVPVRFYTLHGLPFANAVGLKRKLLEAGEKLSCALAHRVLAVGKDVRFAVVTSGVCGEHKIAILAHGSVNGVDSDARFNRDRITAAKRLAMRQRFGVPDGSIVVGFIGRIARDKGIRDLLRAWKTSGLAARGAHLLIVGPVDERDPADTSDVNAANFKGNVHMAGELWDTPPIYAILDIFCLPTYREGFPVSCLEAAAMGIPTIASDIPGVREAVVHNVTGVLVPPGDPIALAAALDRYFRNPELRRAHGIKARDRAQQQFQQRPIWEELLCEYRACAGLANPTPSNGRSRRSLPPRGV